MRAFCKQFLFMGLLLVLVQGCGRPHPTGPHPAAPPPEKPADLPAPGTMAALPAEKVELESKWTTLDIWTSISKNSHGTITPFGLKETTAGVPGQYKVEDTDNGLFLVLDVSLDLDKVGEVKIKAPQSKHVGVWWTGAVDPASKEYPFHSDKYLLLKETDSGTFAGQFPAPAQPPTPNTAESIQVLRVDLYGMPGDNVEVQWVKIEVPRHATFPEVKPPKLDLTPNDTDRAQALLVRARVLDSVEDWDVAATEVSRWGLFADPGVKELGEKARNAAMGLLDAGNAKDALRDLSIAVKTSEQPAQFLDQLTQSLTPEKRTKLWPGKPYLVYEGFEFPKKDPFFAWREAGKRKVKTNEITKESPMEGQSCGHLVVGEAAGKGDSWYVLYTSIPVSDKPYKLRFWYREANPSATKGLVFVTFPDKVASVLCDVTPTETRNGWKCAEASHLVGFGAECYDGKKLEKGCFVSNVGLDVEGGANEFWVDSVEICLP